MNERHNKAIHDIQDKDKLLIVLLSPLDYSSAMN